MQTITQIRLLVHHDLRQKNKKHFFLKIHSFFSAICNYMKRLQVSTPVVPSQIKILLQRDCNALTVLDIGTNNIKNMQHFKMKYSY